MDAVNAIPSETKIEPTSDKISTNTGASSSSLFYDPFAAARTTLNKKEDAEKLAIWCCHLECVVDVFP